MDRFFVSVVLLSILFAVLALIATYAMIARKFGVLTGIAAAGILASTWEFFMLGRWVQVDMALVFGVALAMYGYLALMDTGKTRYAVVLGVAAGIAFMAKGLVGPALIAAAVLADMIRRRDLAVLWKIKPHIMIVFAVIVVLPWILALWFRGGWPFIREIIVVNNLMRFTGAPEGAALGHQHGPLYYLGSLPDDILPWTLICIPALIASVRNIKQDPYLPWFIGPFLLLVISSTKRVIYLAPMYPALACMAAVWIEKARRARWETIMVKITWGLAAAACFAPFAGIFLGQAAWGIAMGLLSLLVLLVAYRKGVRVNASLSLVLLVCIAMSSTMTVYYRYEKPYKDYLSFARQALALAGGNEIIILAPDEIFEGVLPMVSGRHYRTVDKPADVASEGYYVFPDREARVLNELRRHARVEILLDRQLDHQGHKFARFVRVYLDSVNGSW